MVIPNGVDTDVFSRSTERRAKLRRQFGVEKDFVWLAVGRLVVQKDYPTLFKALEMLPHDRFVVLIAGDGPLEKSLRKECNARHLAGKVRFCGLRKDVIDLYDAADGFVMSSNSEGLPMAALEAAAMGLPAVVTHVGGTAEIVIDRVTGYVVPPGDAQQLASGLQRVMHASPESRGIMGRAARQHCQNNYGMDAIVQKWLDLYAECFSPARVLTATRTHWNFF
jgi:glycosyltransferase involved in cell wall biosynthesis